MHRFVSYGRLGFVIIAIGIIYLLVQRPEIRDSYANWDKYAHAVAFLLVWFALRWSLSWPVMQLTVLSAALGGAVEIHQMFLPGFNPSWADWAADLGGIAVAVGIFGVFRTLSSSVRAAVGRER